MKKENITGSLLFNPDIQQWKHAPMGEKGWETIDANFTEIDFAFFSAYMVARGKYDVYTQHYIKKCHSEVIYMLKNLMADGITFIWMEEWEPETNEATYALHWSDKLQALEFQPLDNPSGDGDWQVALSCCSKEDGLLFKHYLYACTRRPITMPKVKQAYNEWDIFTNSLMDDFKIIYVEA